MGADIADNVIGDAGAKFLAAALGSNTTLGLLDLDVNPISQGDLVGTSLCRKSLTEEGVHDGAQKQRQM